jgi:triosephosphate isomerase
MGRRLYIAGNWKMNKTLREALDTVGAILERLDSVPPQRRLLLFPPATLLHPLRERIGGHPLDLGGQNVSWAARGALTGEISPVMLLDAGCTYALVGHSERRHVLGERPEWMARKLQACREYGLRPVLCIGETLEEREAGRTEEILERQLREGLEGWEEAPPAGGLLVAYEPVWAIGTGRTATVEQIEEAHALVRRMLAARWGRDGETVPILYGGSVKPENAPAILELPGVDGVLVGGASLEAESFLAIATAAPGA